MGATRQKPPPCEILTGFPQTSQLWPTKMSVSDFMVPGFYVARQIDSIDYHASLIVLSL